MQRVCLAFNSLFTTQPTIKKTSSIDHTKEYDQANWCVSIICAPGGLHAQIVVEGVSYFPKEKVMRPFIKLAHLVGPSTIDLRRKNKEKFFNSPPGSTYIHAKKGIVKGFKEVKSTALSFAGYKSWVVSKKNAKKMIKEVDKENEKEVEFFYLGRHSILSAVSDNFLSITGASSIYLVLSRAILPSLILSEYLKSILHRILENTRSVTQYVIAFNLFVSFMESGSQPRDNCFTWAREKLRIAGLHISPSGILYSVITDVGLQSIPANLKNDTRIKSRL